MTAFAGLISRWTIALVAACSSEIRPDAPPTPAEALLRSCATVLESSCDSGWASCDATASCWCYQGPRMTACVVPCSSPGAAPTCDEIGCTTLDTIECRLDGAGCVCIGHVTGVRDECVVERC